MMALRGVKVVELAGLAPAPFCGMILADFGARVIRVDKLRSQTAIPDTLARGKQSISVNLKHKEGVEVVRRLCGNADVLIEPFRAGVMEKMGLGPDILLKENPALVYARLTGYGQHGPMTKSAGHDINFISTSGVLSMLGRKDEKPTFPLNLLADFAGGGLTCALGIVLALFERSQSGRGQVVDASMTAGSAYVASFLWSTKNAKLPIWGGARGENMLDTGLASYDTYRTSDDKYMAVGSLEPKFYSDLLKGLGLDPKQYNQFQDQSVLKHKFTEVFLTKTREEWTQVFNNLDACVTPVLEMAEAPKHTHNQTNGTFLTTPEGKYEPAPAPTLGRTPGVEKSLPLPKVGEHTREVLAEIGYSNNQVNSLLEQGIVDKTPASKL